MDFAWSEEQAALRQTVVRFAQQELNHDVIDLDRRSEFPWDSWKRCASMGIQGLPVPMEFGGGGTDILTTVCALEGLGYGCRDNGLIFSINAHMWASEIPIGRSVKIDVIREGSRQTFEVTIAEAPVDRGA